MSVDRRIAWIFDTSTYLPGARSAAEANEAMASTGRAAEEAIKQLATGTVSATAALKGNSDAARALIEAEGRLLAARREDLEAVKAGAAAVVSLNQKRAEEIALAKASVTAESGLGQELLALREGYRQVEQEIGEVVAAHRREAQAAAAEAAALERLEATLVSLAAQEVRLTETIGANRSGASAVAALNLEYERRNQLLAAGVGLIDAEGRFVITNEEGAAAVLRQVAALEAEEATLARLRVAQGAQIVAGGLSREASVTSATTAASQQGPAAVAALNRELAVQNQLLSAGVAQIDAEGKFVVLYEEEAAVIRSKVAALQAEQAALAEVRAQQEAAAASARKVGEEGAAGAGIFSTALGEVLQALKYIVVYGALFAGAGMFKQAVTGALDYEASLTRLRTLVGLTAQEVDGFRASIHSVSTETAQSADDNAKALFAITSSGLRGAAANEALEASAKGAAIGLGDQTTVARAATAAVLAYGAGNISAKGATDVLIATAREGNVQVDQLAGSLGRVIPIASTVGVSYAQVGAAVASMTRLGLSADEAVTGLRGTLSALSLKEGKGAEAVLKSVGFSVAGLRQEIQEKGLAQALVNLVQRFNGNEDALAKIIPNVRALAEVLGNAKNQGQGYVEIQDRINASIGHATDEAFELEKHDPSFVWKQAGIALEEVGRALGESVLPTIVDVATEVRKAAADGAFEAWAQAGAVAFKGLVEVGRVAAFALQNLPLILAAYGAYALSAASAEATLTASTASLSAGMFTFSASATTAEVATFALTSGTGSLAAGMFSYAAAAGGATLATEGLAVAEAELVVADTGLLASIEAITTAIEANYFGAAAAAVLVLVGVVNHFITTSKEADQAFLNEVAASNQSALALEKLSHQYDVLAVSKRAAAGSASGVGLITGPAKVSAGASANSQIVLRDSGADNFVGQLNAINAAYLEATKQAGNNKTAVDAAKIARDRSIATLQSETQALIENAKAAIENEKANNLQLERLQGTAKQRVDAARDAVASISASSSQGYQAQYGPHAQETLRAAERDLGNVSKALEIHRDRVTTSAKALGVLQQQIDYTRASQQQHTESVAKASKAEENFHDQLQKSIDVRNAQAAGIRLEAAAELIGTEAVRQATIAAQQHALIVAAEDKARHDKTTVSAKEIADIKASVVAESDANLEKQRGNATRLQQVTTISEAVTAEAKYRDAVSGNTFASRAATVAIQAEAQARKLGYTVEIAGVEFLSARGLALKAEAAALLVSQIASENRARAVTQGREAVLAQRDAEAKLQDVLNQNTLASSANALAVKIENEQRARGAVVGLPFAAGIALETTNRWNSVTATEAQTVVEQKLRDLRLALGQERADFADWQTQTAFAVKYGTELAGIYQQYGLLTKASEELAVEQEVLAANAGASTSEQRAANEKRIRDLHAQIDAVKQAWADANIQRWITQPLRDAEQSIQADFWEPFNAEILGTEANWKSFAENSEKALLQAIEQGLLRFIAAEQVKQAEALKTLAIQRASAEGGTYGGVTGATPSSAFVTGPGGGAQPIAGGGGISGLFSGGAFGGNAFGLGGAAAVGAWVAVFAAIYFGASAWLKHVQGSFAQATLAFEGEGNLAVNSIKGDSNRMGGVIAGLQKVGQDAEAFYRQFNATITGLDGSIVVSKKGHGSSNDFWVNYANGLVEDFGRDADAAFNFALVQAIKQSKTRGLDPLTRAAIADSAGKDPTALLSDAQVGHTLATQNLGENAAQMQAAIDLFNSQFQQATVLFKNDTAAFASAVSSEVQKLGSSLWDAYYSLTGKQEDPNARAARLAAEYETERALAIAQLEIAKAEILAQEALLAAHRAYVGGGGEGGGGTGLAGITTTVLSFAKVLDLATKPLAQGVSTVDDALQRAYASLQAAEANLPPDITPGDVQSAHSGRGSGNSRQQAHDTFEQHLDQLRQSQMGAAVKAVDDYRNQLIALRKEEDAAKASTVQRAEAERLLRAELDKTLGDILKPWTTDFGKTDFQNQIAAARQSLTDVQAALAARRALSLPPPQAPKPPRPKPIPKPPGTKTLAGGSTTGGNKPSKPLPPMPPVQPPVTPPQSPALGPTRAEIAEAQRNITTYFTGVADAAIASFRGLSGGLAEIKGNADDLRKNVLALGLDSSDTAKRLAQIDLGQAYQIQQGQLGVMDKLFGYLKASGMHAAQVEEFEKEKVRLDFQLLQAQMVAFGIWNDANTSLFVQAEQAAFQQAHDDAYSSQNQAAAAAQQAAASTQANAATVMQQTAAQFAAATQKLVDFSKSFLTDSATSFLSVRGQVDAARQQLDQTASAALGGSADARDQFQQYASNYLTKFSDVFGRGSAFSAESKRIFDLLQQVIGMNGPADAAAAAAASNLGYSAGGAGTVVPYTPPPISADSTDDPARQAAITTALNQIKEEATRAVGEASLHGLGFSDSVIQSAETWAKGGAAPMAGTAPPLTPTDLSGNIDRLLKSQSDGNKDLTDTLRSTSSETGKMLTAIGKAVDAWKSKAEGDGPKLATLVTGMSEKLESLSTQLSRLMAKLDKLVPST